MKKQAVSRRAQNQARIRQIATEAHSDLDALARLFEDAQIEDDGTVVGRVTALLEATERRLIPGLQTAVPFGDTGFAGDRLPDGEGFRDPWPSSRNQVGHFLTAVGLHLAPEVVSRPIPLLGSIRAIVGAPAEMSDEEVALRLSIGHEKAPDPRNALPAMLRVLVAGSLAGICAVSVGVGKEVRRCVVAAALLVEALHQARAILAGFRSQFAAATEQDLAAWNEALRMCGSRDGFNRWVVDDRRSPLHSIVVANGEGNSIQDLRLTLVGWQLGQLIGGGAFGDGQAVGSWIRRTLTGEERLPQVPQVQGDTGNAERSTRDSDNGQTPMTDGSSDQGAWVAMAPKVRRVAGIDRVRIAHAVLDSAVTQAAVAVLGQFLPIPQVQLTQYEVVTPHLPRHLDGLRVLHLSDLHVHPGSDLAWQVPDLVAGVPHDLICYTGDFIDVDSDIQSVAQLLARMPSDEAYAVLGNHDYIPYGRAHSRGTNDSKRLRAVLSEAGVQVLANDARPLFDGTLYIAGVDDPATGRDNVNRAYDGVPAEVFTLLLAHSPDIVLRLGAYRPDLVLCGHTHGGQIRLPLLGMVVTLSHVPRHLASGLGQHQDVPLFVSRGIGYSGLNMRLGTPSEVALLTLRAARVGATTIEDIQGIAGRRDSTEIRA